MQKSEQRIVFSTVVRTTYERKQARMLAKSLRAFGGPLQDCPIWLFEADPKNVPCCSLAVDGVRVRTLKFPESLRGGIFAERVAGYAQAEELAKGSVETLVCIDPGCLVVNPPLMYDLGAGFDVAVRPVHIRNIGSRLDEPLDPFWEKIYRTVELEDTSFQVESYVDRQVLRAYFNSHSFCIKPSLGLLHQWLGHYQDLFLDEAFQQTVCADERHQIFLFQAILSALLAKTIDPQRLRILPPSYNYPYNLHMNVPEDRRAGVLNELISITYEDRSLDPARMTDITVEDPLRTWLSERVPHV